MTKETKLFPMSVNPVRDGVYKIYRDSRFFSAVFSRWYKGKWRLTSDTVEDAAHQTEKSMDVYSGRSDGWVGLKK